MFFLSSLKSYVKNSSIVQKFAELFGLQVYGHYVVHKNRVFKIGQSVVLQEQTNEEQQKVFSLSLVGCRVDKQ